eukprot:SAG25_NODE_442_length_7969_cov_22.346203_3_plen_211_part_00
MGMWMQMQDDIMHDEAELAAAGWTDREREAFAELFDCDPIEVPCALLLEEMRERLTARGRKGKAKSKKKKSTGPDDWLERRMAVAPVRPEPPEPESDGPEPEPEGTVDGLELLPATITFVDRNFEIMSCCQAQKLSPGGMRCFVCKGSVEHATQHVYHGVDVLSTEKQAWETAGAEEEVFICVDCSGDTGCHDGMADSRIGQDRFPSYSA